MNASSIRLDPIMTFHLNNLFLITLAITVKYIRLILETLVPVQPKGREEKCCQLSSNWVGRRSAAYVQEFEDISKWVGSQQENSWYLQNRLRRLWMVYGKNITLRQIQIELHSSNPNTHLNFLTSCMKTITLSRIRSLLFNSPGLLMCALSMHFSNLHRVFCCYEREKGVLESNVKILISMFKLVLHIHPSLQSLYIRRRATWSEKAWFLVHRY